MSIGQGSNTHPLWPAGRRHAAATRAVSWDQPLSHLEGAGGQDGASVAISAPQAGGHLWVGSGRRRAQGQGRGGGADPVTRWEFSFRGGQGWHTERYARGSHDLLFCFLSKLQLTRQPASDHLHPRPPAPRRSGFQLPPRHTHPHAPCQPYCTVLGSHMSRSLFHPVMVYSLALWRASALAGPGVTHKPRRAPTAHAPQRCGLCASCQSRQRVRC